MTSSTYTVANPRQLSLNVNANAVNPTAAKDIQIFPNQSVFGKLPNDPLNDFTDSEWAQKAFLVSNSNISDSIDQQNRFFSTANWKFTNTSFGGNFGLNTRPQFTRYADIRVPGRMPGVSYDINIGFNTNIGIGRYYSEAIDDLDQIIYLQFGVPQFNSMANFIANFFNAEDAYIANTGRLPLSFTIAKTITSIAFFRYFPLLFLGSLALKYLSIFTEIGSYKYYYLKPTMHTYWATVNTLINAMAAKLEILPAMPYLSTNNSSTSSSSPQEVNTPYKIPPSYLQQLHKWMPDVFTSSYGIDAFAVSTRVQRYANLQFTYYYNHYDKMTNIQRYFGYVHGSTGPTQTGPSGQPYGQHNLQSQLTYGIYAGLGKAGDVMQIASNSAIGAAESVVSGIKHGVGVITSTLLGSGDNQPGSPINEKKTESSYKTKVPKNYQDFLQTAIKNNIWYRNNASTASATAASANTASTDTSSSGSSAYSQVVDFFKQVSGGSASQELLFNIDPDTGKKAEINALNSKMNSLASYINAEWGAGGSFVTFRVNYTGATSMSASNSVGESSLSQMINQKSQEGRQFRFSLENGNIENVPFLDTIVGAVGGAIQGVASAIHIDGIINAFLGNVNVQIPKYWESSSVDLPTSSYTMDLVSPYGNVLSLLQNIYMPIAAIMGGALPLATGKASYTSPPICRLYDRGKNQIELGMINSISIETGTGNQGYTEWCRPINAKVTFSVINLDSIMCMPVVAGTLFGSSGTILDVMSTDNPLSQYLSTITGQDIYSQLYPSVSVLLKLSAAYKYYDSLISRANFASALFQTTTTGPLGWTQIGELLYNLNTGLATPVAQQGAQTNAGGRLGKP